MNESLGHDSDQSKESPTKEQKDIERAKRVEQRASRQTSAPVPRVKNYKKYGNESAMIRATINELELQHARPGYGKMAPRLKKFTSKYPTGKKYKLKRHTIIDASHPAYPNMVDNSVTKTTLTTRVVL